MQPVSTTRIHPAVATPPGIDGPVPKPGSEEAKVRDMTQQFEAMFLRQILNDAQKPVIKSSLTPQSSSKGIYQDMMVNSLADTISHSGSFGLARTLEAQFRQSEAARAKKPDSPAASHESCGTTPT